jgi:Derlin-2/3
MLEESSFPNRKADYFWLLLFSAILLLVSFVRRFVVFVNRLSTQLLSPLFNLPFLSSPLAFVPIYFWSRRHPSTHISLFGLVTITAPYLPVALIAFRYASGYSARRSMSLTST